MKKLSKEKKTHLILAVAVTLLVVGGLYFTLIRMQLDGLRSLDTKKKDKVAKLKTIEDTKKNSKLIEDELVVISAKLQAKEDEMASGDLYSTMIAIISKFKQSFNVDIPQFTSGGGQADCNLFGKFPYKQVTVIIAGTGYYHDVGQFVANFENRFPSSRILNLELSPASTEGSDAREKLSFRMEVVSLVKPGGVRPTGTR